ncbi:MAG: hypothetical protein EXR79_00300 [Myxococcales bacterium]|nr:hypothetical protein [Myxococcales bacterium]
MTPTSPTIARAWARLRSIVLATAIAACGAEPPAAAGSAATTPAAAAPSATRTKQQPITADDWGKEVAADTSVAAAVQAAGGTWQAAGRIEDSDGVALLWAEYAPDPGAGRTHAVAVFKHCKAGACTAGTARYTDSGANFFDSKGGALPGLLLGEPVLSKTLKGHSLDQDPTVLAPLTRSWIVDTVVAKGLFAGISFKKRRCVVLNAFGAAIGAGANPVLAAATKTGLFDAVEVIEYARRQDLERMLQTLTPLDVLVVLAPGVMEPVTATGGGTKPIGVMLSRGVVGDEIVHYKHIKDLLPAPPLGGAGLIILAGSNTLTESTQAATSSFATVLAAAPTRVVVAVHGKIGWAQANKLAGGLLTELAAGKELEVALGTAALGVDGVKLLAPMEKTIRQTWKIAASSATFWAKPPSKADLTVYVKVDPPKCVTGVAVCHRAGFNAGWSDASKRAAATDLTAGAIRFDCSPSFDGPWFACGSDDPATGAKFALKGVMRGRGIGDRFWFWLEGSASKAYRDLAVVGEGAIEKADVGGGTTLLQFRGLAAAAPYLDGDDRCCVASSPLLQGYKNEPGTFKLLH